MSDDTKLCKYCKTEIPKKAKVCPNCRKKQGGKLKWIIVAIVVIIIIAAMTGGGSDEPKAKKTGEVSSSAETEEKSTTDASDKNTASEEVSNVFHVGDVVETDDLKITFLSAEPYQEDNEFMQPKDGYEYWKFEFNFENISDSDQTVSSIADWECYADNTKVDQSWIGDDNGLDGTLSSGRTTQGSIYFEVPVDAQSIELEYDINFWQSDKIIFVGK